VDDLDDLLGGVQLAEDLLADGLFLDTAHQALGHLVVDIGLEQRQAHLAERLLDALFGELALAGQLAHGPFEAPGQVLEHSGTLFAAPSTRAHSTAPAGVSLPDGGPAAPASGPIIHPVRRRSGQHSRARTDADKSRRRDGT